MKKIVLATKNQNKIKEYNALLGSDFKLISLDEIGFGREVEETGATSTENAKIKAQAVFDFMKENNIDYPVLSDDSGLFVNALGGEPGVMSARYAGDHNDAANRKKVLDKLGERLDRTAYFECVLCYMYGSDMRIFMGRCFGEITTEELGKTDFGYDCIFYSDDLQKTFGEATKEEKDSVSHRARAVEAFKKWMTPSNPNFSRHVTFNK
mgnify:CR=1 FL=1